MADNDELVIMLLLCGEPECQAADDPIEKLRALIDANIALRAEIERLLAACRMVLDAEENGDEMAAVEAVRLAVAAAE
jgi:hypothetical protein